MSNTTGEPAKKPRRTHTFGACNNCRRRHVKCDQVRPNCLTCKATGLSCEGYRTELRWVTTSGASAEVDSTGGSSSAQSGRRFLYSGKFLQRPWSRTAVDTRRAIKTVYERGFAVRDLQAHRRIYRRIGQSFQEPSTIK